MFGTLTKDESGNKLNYVLSEEVQWCGNLVLTPQLACVFSAPWAKVEMKALMWSMSVFLVVSGLILEYLNQGEMLGAVEPGKRRINCLVESWYLEVLSDVFLPKSRFWTVTGPPQTVTGETFVLWRTLFCHNVTKPLNDRSKVQPEHCSAMLCWVLFKNRFN